MLHLTNELHKTNPFIIQHHKEGVFIFLSQKRILVSLLISQLFRHVALNYHSILTPGELHILNEYT